MGYSTKSIGFFSDEITIRPHSATEAKWLDRNVSIKQFAPHGYVSLEEIIETGELIVRKPGNQFIQGPQVLS